MHISKDRSRFLWIDSRNFKWKSFFGTQPYSWTHMMEQCCICASWHTLHEFAYQCPFFLHTTNASACLSSSPYLCVSWDVLEWSFFLGALCDCASGQSSTSAWVECHNVPVSPWDVPKERGKRQPSQTMPIHHRDTTCCSHGKPTAGQSLWTRARRGRGGGPAIH